MFDVIEYPRSCELRSVIRFLLARHNKPIEIHRQLCEVYGNGVMSEGVVRKWCVQFKNGRTNVHDERRSGRPSLVSDELVAKIQKTIRENRHFTITELSEHFPHISRSLVHEILVNKLGYHKFSARSSEEEEESELNIPPDDYKRKQGSEAFSIKPKSSVDGAEKLQGGICMEKNGIIQSKQKEKPYDNQVESKKRKTTKSDPKKGVWKKKTTAATVGDSQHVTCCALACTNTSESCTVVSLPTDPHLREQWLHNIDRQDWTPSQDSMLCQIHFEPDLWEEDKDGKKSLKPDAVPSLFLHGETIKSWVTLDREGNVNKVLVRDRITEEKKDCDESIDIEESDVYIKQEPEIDVMVNCDESSDPSTTFQATFVGPKQEQIDDIKPPVITVSFLHAYEPETIVPEIVPVVIKSEPMEEEEGTTSAAVVDTSKDDEDGSDVTEYSGTRTRWNHTQGRSIQRVMR
uniref:THAP-type domain-containing protein n=1 Tax=Homalodisca liturata TaxID=320908 RepID=A0A1B6H756_9HEMI